MFLFCNIASLTKYFFIWASTQFLLCMAIPKDALKEQMGTKDEAQGILYSWEHHSSSSDDSGKIVYIIICIVIGVIVLLIRCCIKYGCENEEDKYSDAVTHPPPVRYPPPAGFTSPNRHTVLAPPNTRSTTLIIPPGFTQGSSAYGGIDNPDFRQGSSAYGGIDNPDFRQGFSAYSGINNPVPPQKPQQSDMLDFPPSYDSVIKSDIKFPKVSG